MTHPHLCSPGMRSVQLVGGVVVSAGVVVRPQPQPARQVPVPQVQVWVVHREAPAGGLWQRALRAGGVPVQVQPAGKGEAAVQGEGEGCPLPRPRTRGRQRGLPAKAALAPAWHGVNANGNLGRVGPLRREGGQARHRGSGRHVRVHGGGPREVGRQRVCLPGDGRRPRMRGGRLLLEVSVQTVLRVQSLCRQGASRGQGSASPALGWAGQGPAPRGSQAAGGLLHASGQPLV